MKSVSGKIILWILVIVAVGIAFWTSFENSIETASIAETDSGAILRVIVLNDTERQRHPANPAPNDPLRLKILYASVDKKVPFPKPFNAILTDGQGNVAARLGEPDSEGCVPEIESFPRGEKYLHVGFPDIKTDGKPTSLMFRNPFCE